MQSAVTLAINKRDDSIIVDLLHVLLSDVFVNNFSFQTKWLDEFESGIFSKCRRLWNLDVCLLLLPVLWDLMQSNIEKWVIADLARGLTSIWFWFWKIIKWNPQNHFYWYLPGCKLHSRKSINKHCSWINIFRHFHISLSTLRLIGHTFGPLIKTNISLPPHQNENDFARQERL